MLGLTSTGLLALTVVGAVLAVAALAVLATRTADPTDDSLSRRITTRTAPVVVLAIVAQGLAVLAVGLGVNNSYGFYTSWSDLLGRASSGATIRTGGLVGSGQGRVQVLDVPAQDAGRNHKVLVWTPPQYDAPSPANRRFPVVEFLPGQPNSPDGVFRHFDFAAIASHLVTSGALPPFVAVFPTLMVAPPRDTECTDVPGGPRAESWLAQDVPAFVTSHFRVLPPGPGWSVMGWSTGGFCAAKLLTAHPEHYSSAVSFGGYYQPLEDRTTGNLFGGRRGLEDHNSPMWLYRHDQAHGGLRGSRILLVVGRQDKESWPETKAMIDLAAADPAVAHLVFPRGGHNYANYRRNLPAALTWSASAWPH